MDFLSSLWTAIAWFFWAFVFIGYLMALFYVISDLFRDHRLSGWWKAVWVFFLIFIPVLTSLVYLIARGNGMAERSRRASVNAQQATESYIRQAAGTSASPAQEIARAAELLEAGTINQAEYDQLKSRALRQG
ncbi:MAG: PLDc N-terminal domain-containing protein [Arachnia sp.]